MAWRPARALVVLGHEIDAIAPNRSKALDGTIGNDEHASRCSRHNPNDADVVCARDVTHDPEGGCDIHAIARVLVARARAGETNPDFEYVVSAGETASRRSGWEWRPYTGSSQHHEHAHFAVGRGSDCEAGPPYDDETPWGLLEDDTMPVTDPKDVAYYQRALMLTHEGTYANAGPPYDLGAAGADGYIGPKTEAAIRDFQERRSIEITGTLTLTTCLALQSLSDRAHAYEQARALAGDGTVPAHTHDGRYARVAHAHGDLADRDHAHSGTVIVQ